MLDSPSAAASSPAVRRHTRSSSSSAFATGTSPTTALATFKATKRPLAEVEEIKVELAQESGTAQPSPAHKKKKRQRRKDDYSHLGADPLTDRIKEDLLCLACGENPGVRTAELQLHYASPANHFYKCVHAAGLTPSVLDPTASRTIHLDHNLGITNLVARPTKEASELTAQELTDAVPIFLRKVATYKPKIVFFVGMKVADTVLRYFTQLPSYSAVDSFPATVPSSTSNGMGKGKKPPPVKAQIGWQPFALRHGAQVKKESEEGEGEVGQVEQTLFYCLPSTSGRVAAYPLPVKLKIWATFGEEVAKLRGGGKQKELDLPEGMRYFGAEELDLPPAVDGVKSRVLAWEEMTVLGGLEAEEVKVKEEVKAKQ
ncbi:hypothetical protein JCM11251_006695 [Rhodosporidiobolus azoricus]